jgi:hypothetical protein
MGHENPRRDGENGPLYRLEVRGTLPQNRSRWFGAESIAHVGPNTVIHLRVMDQSDLHGRLRKIHDLNLQLISLQRLEGQATPEEETDGGPVKTDPPSDSRS